MLSRFIFYGRVDPAWLPFGACGSLWQGLWVVLLQGVATAEGMTLLME